MTWDWVDPVAGAAKAAKVLRADGRLAVFWNIALPPSELATAFAAVYRRVVSDTPLAGMPPDPLAAYERILTTTADAIRATAAFTEPQRQEVDWERTYTTGEWLEQVPTFGGHSQLPPAKLDHLLDRIGAAVEDAGGSFTNGYAAVAITATRRRAAS